MQEWSARSPGLLSQSGATLSRGHRWCPRVSEQRLTLRLCLSAGRGGPEACLSATPAARGDAAGRCTYLAPSHRTPEDTISKYAANLVADGHAAPSGARQLLGDIVAHPEMRLPRVVRRVDVEPGALSQVTCPLRRSAPSRGSRSADDCSRFDAIRHSIQHLDTAAFTPMNTLSLLRRVYRSQKRSRDCTSATRRPEIPLCRAALPSFPAAPTKIVPPCFFRLRPAKPAPIRPPTRAAGAAARTSGGAIAQLVERLNGIQEVRGSTPLGSTNRP